MSDESSKTWLLNVSISMIRAVREVYGNEVANQYVAATEAIIGKDWTRNIVYRTTAGIATIASHYHIEFTGDSGSYPKITSIKALRHLTRMGLTSAKNTIEMAASGTPQVIQVDKMQILQITGQSEDEFDQAATEHIEELAKAGFRLEMIK